MCVALTVYVGGPDAEAQSKPGPPTGTFALEVRYGNNTVKYYRVSETFRSRIWSRSEKTGQLYLSTNQTILESAPEGDAVRIDLAVHLDEKDASPIVKRVGTHLLQLNQPIALKEFEEYGETYTVRLVRILPEKTAAPLVTCHVKSFEVVGPMRTADAAPTFEIELRNHSDKPVIMLSVSWDGGWPGAQGALPGMNLIEPSGVRKLTVSGKAGLETPDGIVIDVAKSVEIKTAIFLDGSVDGDADFSDALFAGWTGDAIMLRRICHLLNSELESGVINLESLRKKTDALPEEPSEDDTDAFLARFPFPEKTSEGPKGRFNRVSRGASAGRKQAFLRDLRGFALRHPDGATEDDRLQWLRAEYGGLRSQLAWLEQGAASKPK